MRSRIAISRNNSIKMRTKIHHRRFFMKVIDLNCDMGESFGNYKLGLDEEVIKHISSANIACGFHAGDPMVMEKTVMLAKENHVAPGAHPGFPDLMGFGRRTLEATRHEITNYIIYQVGALMAFCKACGLKLQHVKTHGKLYSNAWEDEFPQRPLPKPLPNSIRPSSTWSWEVARERLLNKAGRKWDSRWPGKPIRIGPTSRMDRLCQGSSLGLSSRIRILSPKGQCEWPLKRRSSRLTGQ